jgi:hypothetical protein
VNSLLRPLCELPSVSPINPESDIWENSASRSVVNPVFTASPSKVRCGAKARGGENGERRGKHLSMLLRNRVSRILNFNSSRMGQIRHNIRTRSMKYYNRYLINSRGTI